MSKPYYEKIFSKIKKIYRSPAIENRIVSVSNGDIRSIDETLDNLASFETHLSLDNRKEDLSFLYICMAYIYRYILKWDMSAYDYVCRSLRLHEYNCKDDLYGTPYEWIAVDDKFYHNYSFFNEDGSRCITEDIMYQNKVQTSNEELTKKWINLAQIEVKNNYYSHRRKPYNFEKYLPNFIYSTTAKVMFCILIILALGCIIWGKPFWDALSTVIGYIVLTIVYIFTILFPTD